MALEEVVTEEVLVEHSIVLRELTRLLENQRFSSSPQMSAFLQYVVVQTLEGNGSRIKAYTIGVDALGKPDAFDAQNDPSVRVLALRLRKALKTTYESGESVHAIIELKPGSYVPEFRLPDSPTTNIVQLSKNTAADVIAGQSQAAENSRLKTANGIDLPYEVSPLAVENAANTQASNSEHSLSLASRSGNRVLKSSLAMIVASAVVYSVATKYSGPATDGLLDQQAVVAGEQMPVRLLAMTAPKPAVLIDNQLVRNNPPSVLLPTTQDQSEQVKQMSLLISASLVEAGAFEVVRTDSIPPSSVLTNNSYALIFNEMSVDSKPRIDMQLVRIDTGSIIMNETLLLDKHTTDFSSGEVMRIENVAHSISDPTGPLSLDVCKQNASGTFDGCA